MDYAYAEGKQNQKFHLLGIAHAMNNKQGRIIYDKVDEQYYIKYIYAKQSEMAMVNRDFAITKKRKRFLFDKKLNQTKMGVELFFDINSDWELLVFEREFIEDKTYDNVEQPEKMKFKMKYAYSPEMWENKTVLTPTNELKKYERKEKDEKMH